jgi:Uma2 family endonuclease
MAARAGLHRQQPEIRKKSEIPRFPTLAKPSRAAYNIGMKWAELCDNPKFQDLPFKIELNRAGQIIMSPTKNTHGYYAAEIARLLRELLPTGKSFVELAIETEDSTKVADAAWASDATFKIIKDEASSSIAPEICVEVRSPGNSNAEIAFKRDLYLKAGAKEYWVCDQTGQMEFFDSGGKILKSTLCPKFPKALES